WAPGEKIEVYCYTNCPKAELFLNGQSLGTKSITDTNSYLTWNVPFQEGELKVVSKADNGKEYTDQLVTASQPNKLELTVDYPVLKADGQDITHLEIQIVDELGKPVFAADDRVKFSVEGPGEIIGIE